MPAAPTIDVAAPTPQERQSVALTLRRPGWLKTEVLGGLVVALALIPEAIAFSVIAGVDPRVGLFASFTMAVTTAVLGGRPAMISAATGAVALVIAPLMASHGLDYLIAAVVLAGVFQVALGLVGAARLMRFVPRSVMVGFVNALAILIFTSQLPELIGVPWLVYPLTAAALAIVFLLPKVTTAVPAPLVAIIVLTIVVVAGGWQVPTVGDKGALPESLPALMLPDVPLTLETLQIIAPYALAMAVVGLLESLMTAKLVDDITDTRSDKTRESWGQGAANIVTGLFGGMGGCAMIGQTVINLGSGGRGRLSGVVAGVMILLFVLFLSPLIERIPLAALVGVMFVVAQQTFAWGSLRVAGKVPANDVLVIVAVTAITVATDLATAVLCGIVIAALNFAWQHARELYADSDMQADGSKLYRVHGTLFFASCTTFLAQFEPADDPQQVTLDCRHLSFVDYSAIAALKTLRERYERAGKHLRVVHLSERCKQLLKRAGE